MPNPQFSDDEIRQRAYEIYQARGGTPGDSNADWQEAIQQLQQEHLTKQKHSIFFWLNRPFVWMEKKAFEPTADWIDQTNIFRIFERISPILEAVGVIAIPVAIWWLSETSQETKERQEKAIRAQTAVQNYLNQLSATLTTGKLKTDKDLQTIVRASTLALLDSPDLQPDQKSESWENWKNDRKGQVIRYLYEAGLIQIKSGQNKSVISLENANLNKAYLGGAYLHNANLNGTRFIRASLSSANLSLANLSKTHLNGAELFYTDLTGANLSGAEFQYANLSYANLSETNLNEASLLGADLSYADLSAIKNWTQQQLAVAWLCKTKLPPGTTLDPDRDCKKPRRADPLAV